MLTSQTTSQRPSLGRYGLNFLILLVGAGRFERPPLRPSQLSALSRKMPYFRCLNVLAVTGKRLKPVESDPEAPRSYKTIYLSADSGLVTLSPSNAATLQRTLSATTKSSTTPAR